MGFSLVAGGVANWTFFTPLGTTFAILEAYGKRVILASERFPTALQGLKDFLVREWPLYSNNCPLAIAKSNSVEVSYSLRASGKAHCFCF
jgi:hypothetical protein